jgi:transcriptional regulator with XRE-family HTH domain
MLELGERLRERGRELGLADAEIARRCGLSQARYQHYVVGRRAPDFTTFVRICRVLGVTPNQLLGFDPLPVATDERERLLERASVTFRTLDDDQLKTAVRLLDALITGNTDHSPTG